MTNNNKYKDIIEAEAIEDEWHAEWARRVLENENRQCGFVPLLQNDEDDMKMEMEVEALKKQLAYVEYERDRLKAAIATPEVYAGVVSDVIAREREFMAFKLYKVTRKYRRLRKILRKIAYTKQFCSDSRAVALKALKNTEVTESDANCTKKYVDNMTV